MPAGMSFEGPAIVEQADTTTVVEPGWCAQIDARGSLVLSANDVANPEAAQALSISTVSPA
jgi:hypothetical protein